MEGGIAGEAGKEEISADCLVLFLLASALEAFLRSNSLLICVHDSFDGVR